MKKPDIHLFDYEDRPILLQIETGAFFEVSGLVAEILRSDESIDREDLIADLSPVHGLEAVAEALSELEAENLVSFGPVCPLLDSDVGGWPHPPTARPRRSRLPSTSPTPAMSPAPIASPLAVTMGASPS